MVTLNITDLNNAKLDVDHIAEVATSVAATSTDRFGNVKSTVSGAVETLKAFNSRGAWATATAYAVKDVVTESGTWYACVVAHTSSPAFATDSASKWRVHQGTTLADLAAGGVSTFAAGIPNVGVTAQFFASKSITTHAHYGFLDNSSINYAVAGVLGHASFNDNVTFSGVQDSDHHHSFQSYPHYASSGTIARLSSFWSQLDHTGAGTITEASLFKASNPLGTGPISTLYGIHIAALTRGTTNYAVYAAGVAPSFFGGGFLIGSIGSPASIKYNPNSGNLDIQPRTGYKAYLSSSLLLGPVGFECEIGHNSGTGNFDLLPRPGYNVCIPSNSFLIGATARASAEKLNVTGDTIDYVSRMYNSSSTAPKGLAVVYSAFSPNGAGNEFIYCQDTLAVRMKVQSNGNLTNVNNSYGAISDLKLKENVANATPKLDDLMRVRVVSYNLRIDPSQRQLGVIAQELEEIFPSMVESLPDRDENGEDVGTVTKSVKYSIFVPMLIKAMQEQQEHIEFLRQQVDLLAAAK